MSFPTVLAPSALDESCVNTPRFLAVDMVEKADSGYPGLPMGSASMAYALWDRALKFNPRDPDSPDRDRFVLSAIELVEKFLVARFSIAPRHERRIAKVQALEHLEIEC